MPFDTWSRRLSHRGADGPFHSAYFMMVVAVVMFGNLFGVLVARPLATPIGHPNFVNTRSLQTCTPANIFDWVGVPEDSVEQTCLADLAATATVTATVSIGGCDVAATVTPKVRDVNSDDGAGCEVVTDKWEATDCYTNTVESKVATFTLSPPTGAVVVTPPSSADLTTTVSCSDDPDTWGSVPTADTSATAEDTCGNSLTPTSDPGEWAPSTTCTATADITYSAEDCSKQSGSETATASISVTDATIVVTAPPALKCYLGTCTVGGIQGVTSVTETSTCGKAGGGTEVVGTWLTSATFSGNTCSKLPGVTSASITAPTFTAITTQSRESYDFVGGNECVSDTASSTIEVCSCNGPCPGMYSAGYWNNQAQSADGFCKVNAACKALLTVPGTTGTTLGKTCGASTTACQCATTFTGGGNSCSSQLNALYLNINCGGVDPNIMLMHSSMPSACGYMSTLAVNGQYSISTLYTQSVVEVKKNTVASCNAVKGCLGSVLGPADGSSSCGGFTAPSCPA